jgi:hypothetical protein
MSRLTKANPTARELVTEILDKVLWWNTLKVIVRFLHAKNVEHVRVEFGDQKHIVLLSDLETFITRSLDEGKIKWGRSDVFFYPLVADVVFMLCNDADLHLASADSSLLLELAHKISSSGIKVYDSGQLI